MTKKTKPGFHCTECECWHDDLMTNIGSTLPDDVWKLSYIERYQRTRHNVDVCTLDEKRRFIRCTLPVPLTHTDGHFHWGLWIEVSRKDHDQYLRTMATGTDTGYTFEGLLANNLNGYGKLIGQSVVAEVRAASTNRPLIHMSPRSRHRLALEQRKGIDLKRHHKIIAPYV